MWDGEGLDEAGDIGGSTEDIKFFRVEELVMDAAEDVGLEVGVAEVEKRAWHFLRSQRGVVNGGKEKKRHWNKK